MHLQWNIQYLHKTTFNPSIPYPEALKPTKNLHRFRLSISKSPTAMCTPTIPLIRSCMHPFAEQLGVVPDDWSRQGSCPCYLGQWAIALIYIAGCLATRFWFACVKSSMNEHAATLVWKNGESLSGQTNVIIGEFCRFRVYSGKLSRLFVCSTSVGNLDFYIVNRLHIHRFFHLRQSTPHIYYHRVSEFLETCQMIFFGRHS